MTKKPSITEYLDDKAQARHAENTEIARKNRLLAATITERETELAAVRERLAKFENPSITKVERLLAGKPSLSARQIAKALDCSTDAAVTILDDMAERGFNVHDGVLSRQPPTQRPVVEHFYGDIVRFGIVSDTHLGNKHCMPDELHEAYEVFRREGITNVYAPGNLIDGEKAYRGQEYEITVMGVEDVVNNIARVWPKVPGITTHHVASSTCHEGYYLKSSGILIGKQIEQARPDMKYLGLDEADVVLHDGPARPTLRIVHPGGGTGYADSYRPQKIVESYAGGDKPTVLAVGHYHKGGYYDIRDVQVIQAQCLERQTPFMRKLGLRAVLGFWMIEMQFTEHGSLRRFRPESFKYYLGTGGKVLRDWVTT